MTTNYVRGASLTCASFQAEIRTLLTGAGAESIRLGPGQSEAVTFTHGGRRFRVAARPDGRGRDHGSVQDAARHRWRLLAQLVRAKLEAVDAGIVTFEEEFLGAMVMPGGRTVYDAAAPGIAAAYRQGPVQNADAATAGATGEVPAG